MSRPAHSSPDTRERILVTAERLFVEHGYAATSLREIVFLAIQHDRVHAKQIEALIGA